MTAGAPIRLAYVMSRFPKLTETFVLGEMLAVERAGAEVELWPLLRERTDVMHEEARPYVARARYHPFLSRAILASQWWYLRHRPRRYLRTLATVLRGTLRSPNFFLGALGIFPKVAHAAREMRAAGIDHVHCHFANHPALAGYVIHRLVGLPYSFTAHGSDLHVDRTFLAEKVARAAFVVAISEDNRREILADCPDADPASVVVLHCGVDTRALRPAGRPVRAEGPYTLTCIGTLHEVKGQAVLVDALGRLARRGCDVALELVGDGPDRAMLEARAAALGVADRVRFRGRLTRPEVAATLERTDVLVAPSVPTEGGKREGIPVVLMEAMAAGVPVVASRLSGIPELVVDDESGVLVPPGDPEALASALEGLLAEPERRARLGAAGRAAVEAGFDADANARALLALVAERSR